MNLIMKQFLVVFVLFVGIGLTTTAWSAPVPKVEICHIPPDNPENVHTIRISGNALPDHLAHGDLVEACDSNCAILCDDGNACTIDDTMDCEENGCPSDREPTDCDDQNLCTNDSCDEATGCMNEVVVCDDGDACSTDICNPSDGQCIETPVVCEDGYTCNPDNGICEEDINPDPECAGQTCLNFTTCNEGGSCDQDGVCGSTAEGGGLCINGSTSCGGLVTCPGGSGDCADGEICFVDSCCGVPVCIPSTQFCSNPLDGPNSSSILLLEEQSSEQSVLTFGRQ